MPARPSPCYLDPGQHRFIFSLVCGIRRTLRGNRDLNLDQISKVNSILAVFEGWMPFEAGTGILQLEIFKFGRMEVRVEPHILRVRFWAWHPVASQMRPCAVLLASGPRAWLADATIRDCVRRLLKRADYRPGPDFCGEGRLQIKWEGSDPSSNPSTTMKQVQHG